MTDSTDHAVAIVGVGAILPDAPDAGDLLEQRPRRPLRDQRGRPGALGPGALLRPRPARRPRRPTRRSAAGCATGTWDPLAWKLPIPPKVGDAMDDAQKWAVACTRMALADCGLAASGRSTSSAPRSILGNAMARREALPDRAAHHVPRARARARAAPRASPRCPPTCARRSRASCARTSRPRLPGDHRGHDARRAGNCIAGRVANLFNLHGPNFTVDAACASAMAAMDAADRGARRAHEFDVAITGGVDRNMGASSFVKFCAIGALSPTGTRPYADGADGFVMGEGAGAVRAQAPRPTPSATATASTRCVRGVGGASDGKGKGITAPNPVGQRLAVRARVAQRRACRPRSAR